MDLDVEGLRQENYNARVVYVRRPHADLMVLRVQPDAPIPGYDAGQWIAIGTGNWEARALGVGRESLPQEDHKKLMRRPYSIGSPILEDGTDHLLSPARENFYELYLALDRTAAVPSPLVTRLFALETGSRLWVADEPKGNNTLSHVRPDDDVLFVATGTGEAPHNRMIWELLRRGHRGRLASVVSTRRHDDQAYRAVHERLVRLQTNYRWIPLVTREPDASTPRVQELLRRGELEERAGFDIDPRRTRVFLCGNPAMVGAPRLQNGQRIFMHPDGMVELLEQRGFRADPVDGNINIHFERY